MIRIELSLKWSWCKLLPANSPSRYSAVFLNVSAQSCEISGGGGSFASVAVSTAACWVSANFKRSKLWRNIFLSFSHLNRVGGRLPKSCWHLSKGSFTPSVSVDVESWQWARDPFSSILASVTLWMDQVKIIDILSEYQRWCSVWSQLKNRTWSDLVWNLDPETACCCFWRWIQFCSGEFVIDNFRFHAMT